MKKLLICKCGDCKHWEIGKKAIKCMTCGDVFVATVNVAPHAKLAYETPITVTVRPVAKRRRR